MGKQSFHHAKCRSITQAWFDYINDEISNQMLNWNNIVPSKDFGFLPTIEYLNVELKGYDFIEGNKKPKFSIDEESAIELLQGAGIYESKFQSIRELLQNSIDSSLIRAWKDSHHTIKKLHPGSDELREIYSKYPININIEKNKPSDDTSTMLWKIEIDDSGTGLSTFDLQYISKTGSSSKNYKKNKIVAQMPSWMRPSGTFGIGFQSVFLLTDTVEMLSKSYFEGKKFEATFFSPLAENGGDILFKKVETDHSDDPGTKISFFVKTEKIPERISIASNDHHTGEIVSNFDPVEHDSFDFEIGKIIDHISRFAEKTMFPINLRVDNRNFPMTTSEKKFDYYVKENDLELTISADPDPRTHNMQCETYYKNQAAKNNFCFEYLILEVNILKIDAKEILSLDRNTIKQEYEEKLWTQIFESILIVLKESFDTVFKTELEKQIGSMFLHSYASLVEKTINLKQFQHWRSYKIKLKNGESKKLGEIFTNITSTEIRISEMAHNTKPDEYSIENDTFKIKIDGHGFNKITSFIILIAQKHFQFIKEIVPSENNVRKTTILIKEEPEAIIPIDLFYKVFSQHLKLRSTSSCRQFIPCNKSYDALYLKPDFNPHYSNIYYMIDGFNWECEYMVSPYIVKQKELVLSNIEKLIEWTFENRLKQETTKKEIEAAYKTFIKDTENIISKCNDTIS